jgi:hypothetical protein
MRTISFGILNPPPRAIVTLAFIFLLSSAVQAHLLWASYSECVAILGEPESRETSNVPPATDAYAFRKSGWGMLIHFWDGRAHCITCSKLDGSELTAAEIETNLNAFGDGKSWAKDAQHPDEIWRSDQKVMASVYGNGFSIFSAEFFTVAVLRGAFH